MTALRLARTELRRLTSGRLPATALIAITLVPLLYGAMYVYANWDPYGRLQNVPAAVVVDDTGGTRPDGTELNAGQQVFDNLAKSGTFQFHRTSQQQAQQGVSSGQYGFALVVPADFSEALLSPGRFDPRQAQLRLVTNDANNYLTGTVADKVADEVRRSVAASAGTQAADQLLLGFSTVHDRTAQAADGAGQLANGADQLQSGLGTAQQGTGKLADGAHQLYAGQNKLLAGSGQLADGTHQLAGGAGQLHAGLQQLQSKTAALPQQTAALADGAEKVADGNQQLADKLAVLGNTSQQLTSTIEGTRSRLTDQLHGLGLDQPAIDQVVANVNKPLVDQNNKVQGQIDQLRMLADGSRKVADGNRKLANATPALVDGINQLTNGSARLDDGAQRADQGAHQLQSGEQQAVSGTGKLSGGADQLDAGAQKLTDGSGRLTDGTHTLRDKLHEGAGQIPNPDPNTRSRTAGTIGDPVSLNTADQASAKTYGAGLAPFFMGLALWVGGYVMFLLLRPLSQRALAAGVAPWRTALGGWLPAALVGGTQAVLLDLVTRFAVGVPQAHPWQTLGFLLLTSFSFTAVVHSLVAAFSSRGKFLGLVLLVLQLVTAGGTFPWQTIPAALHPVHEVMPLTYVVNGLRQLLYGGPDPDITAQACGVLVCYLVAGLMLSTAAAWKQQVWTPARVKPELSL